MSSPSLIRVVAVLTCHNRREKTLASLRAFFAQDLSSEIKLEAVLVDDGSTDGTGQAVRAQFPGVTVLEGSGNLYWCGGMRVAWAEAAKADPEYYLLLNDDTMLVPSALNELLAISSTPDSTNIAVGAISDGTSDKIVYGGIRYDKAEHPAAQGQPVECDTMNTNCAMVPREIYRRLGGFHKAYTHAMGDMDYGLAAGRAGGKVIQTAHIVGTCQTNPVTNTWRDASLSRAERLRLINSPKGLPWKEWLVYVQRNCGSRWPRYFLSPYIRILLGK